MSEDSTLRRYPDPANPWMSYVVGDTVVPDANGVAKAIASHSHVGSDTLWDVTVRLTPSAAASLARQTSAHMGDTIAVLVDDRVVSIGIINGELGAVAPVMLGASRAVAKVNEAVAANAPAAATPSSAPAAAEPVDVEAVLEGMAAQNKQTLDWRHSIVDLMKLVGIESDLASRKSLAQEVGYTAAWTTARA